MNDKPAVNTLFIPRRAAFFHTLGEKSGLIRATGVSYNKAGDETRTHDIHVGNVRAVGSNVV